MECEIVEGLPSAEEYNHLRQQVGWDGYNPGVIVDPIHQRQGIGTKMMDRVMAYIGNHASQNSIVGLMSAYGKESFYEKYGFVRRPTDRLGCGMTRFWRIEQK